MQPGPLVRETTLLDCASRSEPWGDWSTSSYILPYNAPNAYTVIQGQCSPAGNGHRGANRYSYDFGMPVNTPFVAARSGTVVNLEESHLDGEVAYHRGKRPAVLEMNAMGA